MTQKRQENEQPSCTLTKARTRSSRLSAWTQPIAPTSPATAAGVSSLRRATTTTFAGRPAKASPARFAPPPVRAGGAAGRLARLGDRLVRHAAGVDDRHVRVARPLLVALGEQPLAHRVRVDVRDLAA